MLKQLPEDDKGNTSELSFLMDCVQKYNFNISAFVELIIWIVY